ncbi:MAG: biotin/lipoyl-containing protein [Candidatus Eisenbacteria bacterium]
MPVLFAFTPSILFEGKAILAPAMDDTIMGGMVTKIHVAQGDEIEQGTEIMTVMDGETPKTITAARDGKIKEILVEPGTFVSGGTHVAETSALPHRIFSSMFSAVLGTVAFSALTMLYLIRKTSLIEWLLLAVGTVLLYWPGFVTDGMGILLVVLVWFLQRSKNKKDALAAVPA